MLKFNFTPNYPADEPPIFTLQTRWLNEEQLELLKTALVRIFKENTDKRGIIAVWVEWYVTHYNATLSVLSIEIQKLH